MNRRSSVPMDVLVWLMFFSATVGVSSGEVFVGFRESTAISASENNSVTQDSRMVLAPYGVLNKIGKGEVVIPAANLSQYQPANTLVREFSRTPARNTAFSPSDLTVREGTLTLRAGTSVDYTKVAVPDVISQKAAFWVDATKNLVTVSSNGTTYVDEWHDVRETGSEGSYAYTRAVADFSMTNCAPEVRQDGDVSSVYFGGYPSKRFMAWRDPSGNLKVYKHIYHVFVVHGVFSTFGFGFVLGSFEYPDFHIGNYNKREEFKEPIWVLGSDEIPSLYAARTYLDGEWVDGTRANVKYGFQLLEVDFATHDARAACFFNDRNISGRQGGESICEVVIFEERLTEENRLRVQTYLMDKWLGHRASPGYSVAVAPNGMAKLDAKADTVPLTVESLKGEGSVVKTGDADVDIHAGHETGVPFRGTLRVAEGSVNLYQPISLAVESGDRVTVNGVRTSVEGDALDGTVVKEGNGTMVLNRIPDDVRRINVNAGTLALAAAPSKTTVIPATAVYGTIPNAGFEAWQGSSCSDEFSDGQTKDGWTALLPNGQVFLFNKSGSGGNFWACDYAAPEGRNALAIKWDASVYTTVSFPVDGVYDLTFKTSARSGYSGLLLDVCLGSVTDENPPVISRIVSYEGFGYTRQAIRLPRVTAGSYKLLFKSLQQNLDRLLLMDDFKLTLLPLAEEEVFPLPNGNFELVDNTFTNKSFTHLNTVPYWTFSVKQGSIHSQPQAGVTTIGMPVSESDRRSNYSNNGAAAYGNFQLGFFDQDGTAETTFTPPPGTYRLRGDFCRWSAKWNGSNMGANNSLNATVTINGTVLDLGEISSKTLHFSPIAWAKSFTVREGDSVTVKLTNVIDNSSLLADNFVLVPVEQELVADGDFEQSGFWTLENNAIEVNNVSLKMSNAYIEEYASLPQFYGYAFFNGLARLRLVELASAKQTIMFPDAGIYRLVFHTASRRHVDSDATFGRNPVRAWLVRDDVTNVIAQTQVTTTNFLKHVFYFSVPAAGNYTFGLQGMSNGWQSDKSWNSSEDRNSFIDGVSIVRADVTDSATPENMKSLSLSVNEGAKVSLLYSGTNRLNTVTLNGHTVTGIIDSTRFPEYVTGTGKILVQPKGTFLTLQ